MATEHCGSCLPCLIGRAALDAGFGRGGDKTGYTISNLAAQPLSTRIGRETSTVVPARHRPAENSSGSGQNPDTQAGALV
ncbi:hypothetical protein CL689_03330 [Candidatus Saccharibacteria bacterium]|nr:hypothetical protein [Candidatus Saccharibacteria bacterium]